MPIRSYPWVTPFLRSVVFSRSSPKVWFLLFLFSLGPASSSQADVLSGQVLEKGTKAPLVAASLYLEAVDSVSATPTLTTDDSTATEPSLTTVNSPSDTPTPPPSFSVDADLKGRYQAILPAGFYRVTVAAEGFQKQTLASLEVRGKTTRNFYLERQGFTLPEVVVSTRRGDEAVVSRETISKEELASVPGTGGDVLRALQALPGVAAAGDFSGQLLVRGGGPEDNIYLSDRIPIAFPFHFGGILSTLNPDLIKSVDFSAGGFGPQYGDYWGGVVDITNREPRQDRWGGRAEVNMIFSEGLLEGPVFPGSSLAVAGRRSYMEVFKDLFSDFTALPSFGDYQAKWSTNPSPGTHLDLQALGSDDWLGVTIRPDSPGAVHDYSLAGNFEFHNGFNSQGFNFRSLLGPRDTLLETGYHYDFFLDTHFGRSLFLNLDFKDYGDRFDWIHSFDEDASLNVGGQIDHYLFSNDAYFVVLPGEGTPGFNLTSAQKIRSQFSTHSNNISFYFDQKGKAFSRKAAFSLGGRMDYQSYNRKLDLSPRFSASYSLSDETTLKGSLGLYTQLPVEGPQLSPDLGNPNLSVERAVSSVLGLEQRLGDGWFLRLEGYDKDLYSVVVGDPVLHYSNSGIGYSRGVEFFLRKAPDGRFFGWISYAFSDSQRLNGPGQAWHVYDYDQPHIATLVAGVRLTPRWEAGLKWRYSSGLPDTPVLGTVYDSANNQYLPVYGAVNSVRLPDYQRLDISTSFTTLYDTWQWRVFLEILNVYDHDNVLGWDYNFDYTVRKEVKQLPLFPYLGLEAKF